MRHQEKVRMSCTSHLTLAWRLSFVLLVHGLMAWIWAHKLSDKICES